ncbi:DUF6883 domain-containing protein [Agrilactobacillus yilanensis]|uniref:DUF6883 domain-containing protein n=1 Tax=Agrilactobacillus yilanensis TaxID=2485997 RepID=A0ABW4J3G9_9LACO|nr:DUF6883 domain-containing protein [Agrilactobacillus yilanensis]
MLEGWEHRHRWSRDPITGKGANGKYQTFVEWKKENVTPEALKQLKINRNKKQDGEILKEYKSVIGKNTPSNLAEFQKLKYNGGRDWQLTKLDYQRRKSLIDNPDLKLPNAGKASIDNRKFTEYLFGGSNEKGLIKGRLITNKLGYSLDNYGSLKNEILKRATEYPSLLKYTDAHGSRYEQKMIMYGPENKPVNIIAGWNVENGKTHMSTILIKEVK